jgi:FtsZ-interacting cell division protein ZipA
LKASFVALMAMSELRLALLVVGSVFLAVLAWWEIRRSRRAQGRPIMREPVIPDELPDMGFEWGLPLLEPPRGEELPEAPQTAFVAQPRSALTVSVPESREPIVEWPADEERQIIALRLVSVLPEQFAGHTLREALLSEGFVLGKFSIFHKPDEAGRAYLSAASLDQPGSFDEAMDSQRFRGLSLFAVLPGPKSPSDTFDDLLSTARGLNDRLEGALQDERGRPLTPLRVASLRHNLPAGVSS